MLEGHINSSPQSMSPTGVILEGIPKNRQICSSAINGRICENIITGFLDQLRFTYRLCKWLADHLKEDYFLHARALEKAVLRAVKESSFGREHVVSSIVKLGFGLLEGVEEKSSKEIKYDCIAGPVELGLEVLKSLFDHHDGVRNEIIQQCILQILSPKPGVMPIIRLLGDLVQSHPHPLLQRASDLKKLLENFTFSDSEISSSLINVLWPLIKCSRDLQDHTILALQKATFRQESSVHVSAAAAIVELILAEQRSEKSGSASLQKSSSEACSCQKTEVYHITGAGLFQELSGLLQRCLCQQARVREIVYHGLLKLVLIDPLVAEHVLNFILPHFQRFLTKDAELLEIINCIIIENGKVFIEEPFDCLLFCTSWIMQLFHQVASNPSDSLDLPGFSLTQENEEGRTLGSRSLSNGLLQIRDLIKTESLSGHKNTESVEVHGQASSSSPSPQAIRSWKDIVVACRPLNVKPAQTPPRPFPGIQVDGVPEEARFVLSFSDNRTSASGLIIDWAPHLGEHEKGPHMWAGSISGIGSALWQYGLLHFGSNQMTVMGRHRPDGRNCMITTRWKRLDYEDQWLGGEETRVSFDKLNHGHDDRQGDLRRQISEGMQRHVEESETPDARSGMPERTNRRWDKRTQHCQSPTRIEKTKRSDHGISRIVREVAELKHRVETGAPYSQPVLRKVTPFMPRVMSIPLSMNFRPWQIKAHSGKIDPQDNLLKFYAFMEATTTLDEVKYRCFLATLESLAYN
ncbi:unnamed protein product [Cuscuta campestris]|uniref:Uncharacterized protein n=1 Tax=Cuscuta campestris TaxID=132261 RepID=A0A484MF94_9ASTE|nr:unnamed protein product [Cuscuta campestris]